MTVRDIIPPKGGVKMETEAQKRARLKYQAKTSYIVKMKLNLKTDAEILEKLSCVPSMAGYIKSLIRRDMLGHGDSRKSAEEV